jgi:uncharacterized protein DUF3887
MSRSKRRAHEPRFSRRMFSSPQAAADVAQSSAAGDSTGTHLEGASYMPIRLLALALLAGFSLAHAAPPKSKAPRQDAASTQQAPESIDVDALARSKDLDGATPADADAPPAQASAPADATATDAIPPADTTPPEAPPVDAAVSEVPAPTGAETAPPAEASAPPAAEPPAPDATVAAPPADAKPKSAASTETAEKISIAASCQARAASLLDDVEKADFGGATSAFDAKMRTALPPPKLKESWDQLAQFGKFVARGQSHLGSGQGYTIVMIPLIFEKANLVAQVACGTDGRIAGFHVTPAPTPGASQSPAPNF